MSTPTATEPRKKRAPAKLLRTRKPDTMSLEDWQIALRRQFAQLQKFKLENLGEEPIFSQFSVTNPVTGGNYRVTIRGNKAGDNHCTCPDFAINTLGTCKHIEYTLGKLERKPGGRRALAAGFEPLESEIYLRYDAKRSVIFRAGRTCPPAVLKIASRYFTEQGELREDAAATFGTFLKEAAECEHMVLCKPDVLAFVAQVRDQASLRARLAKAFSRGLDDARWNKLLRAPLYRYQRQGALFAASAGRSLIADDMGLGKTIQAIAAAELLAKHGGAQRVLIVCPTSLKYQWQQEIEKFTARKGEQIQVIEGSLSQRAAMYQSESLFKISNYDVIHRDLDAIHEWAPDLVILDEAQRIKNWQTRVARSVKRLDSTYAIVLTGTPLENRLEELHSIVEFVDRYRLGPAFRFLHEHQHTDESGRVVGYRNLDRISKTLAPILIRRTKKEVLKELPPRLEKRLFVPMTPQQQAHHDENKEIVAKVVQKWRRFGFLSDADQRRLMIAMQNMRMSCNSTYLLDQDTDHGTKVDELCTQLHDVFEDPQSKVVIFSQWVRTHELLERRFQKEGWKHVLFHGGVPSAKRKDLVQQFKQETDCRCFLSTDAGGVGLNLQHANVVVNVDQPWNPAVLEQRIGRVHRLGQQRPVSVVNLIAKGTIEEGMLKLIEFKRSVFAGVLDGGENEVFLGGSRLKRFMESVENATDRITPPMVSESSEPEAGEAMEDKAASRDAGTTNRAGNTSGEGNGHDDARPATSPSTQPSTSPADDAWRELATLGATLLRGLRDAIDSPRSQRGDASSSPPSTSPLSSLVARDSASGEPYLKLPMPSRDTLDSIAQLLGSLIRK